jgi:hypothetical protein
MIVKKLIGLGLLLVACRGSIAPKTAPPPGAPGAADPKSAVAAYINAVAAQDLQAMSAVWGTPEGSVRTQLGSDEIMKREVVVVSMLKCIRKGFSIISDATAGPGQRSMVVDLTYVPPAVNRDSTRTSTAPVLTRATNFAVVQAKDGRWYVSSFELNKVNDICLAR